MAGSFISVLNMLVIIYDLSTVGDIFRQKNLCIAGVKPNASGIRSMAPENVRFVRAGSVEEKRDLKLRLSQNEKRFFRSFRAGRNLVSAIFAKPCGDFTLSDLKLIFNRGLRC